MMNEYEDELSLENNVSAENELYNGNQMEA